MKKDYEKDYAPKAKWPLFRFFGTLHCALRGDEHPVRGRARQMRHHGCGKWVMEMRGLSGARVGVWDHHRGTSYSRVYPSRALCSSGPAAVTRCVEH